MATKLKFNVINPKDWGKLEWIDVKKLVIPDEGETGYQREGLSSHIEAIAQHWNPHLVGTLIVLRRLDHKNELQVADGGQRTRAAMLRNAHAAALPNIAIGKLPCYVIDIDNDKAAASIFSDVNTVRRAVAFVALHNAQLLAENPSHVHAQAVTDYFKEHGVIIFGMKYLTKISKKTQYRDALRNLQPLLIELGQRTKTHCISTTLMQGILRLEVDMVARDDTLAKKKWSARLLAKGGDYLHDLFSSQPRSKGHNERTFAVVLAKVLNIRPNPYSPKFIQEITE